MRPSIFDPSPLLFLDRTDSSPGVPFAFLLLPLDIFSTVHYESHYLFLLDAPDYFFSLSSPHTAFHFSVGHPLQPSALSLAHAPSQPFTFLSLLLFSYLLPPPLILSILSFIVLCFSDILFPCRLMIHFLTCLVNARSFGSYRFRTTRI